MIRAALRNIAACLALACLPLTAAAHRVGIPVTTIEWNPGSETWEIIHRLDSHDFDPVMHQSTLPSKLYATTEGILAIGDYIHENFSISGDIETQYIGAEQEGDFVWIYFEMQAPDQIIEIRDHLLMREGTASTALVNVKTPSGITSLVYTNGDAPKMVNLRRPG